MVEIDGQTVQLNEHTVKGAEGNIYFAESILKERLKKSSFGSNYNEVSLLRLYSGTFDLDESVKSNGQTPWTKDELLKLHEKVCPDKETTSDKTKKEIRNEILAVIGSSGYDYFLESHIHRLIRHIKKSGK